jgi:serine/threonine-protein kinase
VAVKVLRPELAAALGPDRFPREIRILARLQHPHILPLLDSGEAEGFLFYTMPFVEGETLRERLDRGGALPVPEAVRILREVADALAAAHAAGVLHRDIKPGNVMLSGRHALVMDFGVAKAVSEAADSAQGLTTVGMTLGTPAYMSPEQAVADPNIDHRADIYALGLMAYEILTGKPPFQGKTAQATLSAQVLEKPKPITEVRGTVSHALGDFVMRCLEKAPDDRWQTTDELVPMLEALGTPSGGITPTQTRPLKAVSPAPPKNAATRTRRILIGAAIAFVLIAGGFGGWKLLGGKGGRGGLGSITRVAVMPLRDISGADAVFAESMQDALITGIAGMDLAAVVPRSELSEKGQSRRIRDVAAEFAVDAVMEGTLFRAGEVMRINLQLVEPQSVRHYWSGSFELNVKNVLAAQDSLVRTINTQLRGVLDGSARKKAAANPGTKS